MSIFRIALVNDKMGSYKKKFYKFSSEVLIKESPYVMDIENFIENEKEFNLGSEVKGYSTLVNDVAIVTDQELVGVKAAAYLNELGRKKNLIPTAAPNYDYDGMEYYDEEEDEFFREEESWYCNEDGDWEKEIKEADEEVTKSHFKGMTFEEIEYIDIAKTLALMGPIEAVKRLATIEAPNFVVIGGFQKGVGLADQMELFMGIRAGIKVMIVSSEVAKTKEFERIKLEKNMDVIMLSKVEDSYYRSYFELKLKDKSLSLKKADADEIFSGIMKIMGTMISEEAVLHAITDAKERWNKKLSKGERISLYRCFHSDLKKRDEVDTQNKIESMTGLANFKEVVTEILAFEAIRKENPKLTQPHRHMIFTGKPGTGKTTSAKLLGDILVKEGICKENFYIVTREDLIGKYIGHTAPKISDLFRKARGGIVFVDEAGFFANSREGDSYLKEAVKEFVRFMEEYPDVMVIFAMYDNEVEDFLELDKGLTSRISRVVEFQDYSKDELFEIALGMFQEKGFKLSGSGREALEKEIDKKVKEKDFGNARAMRKIVEEVISNHCVRLYQSPKKDAKQSLTIKAEDFKDRFSKRLDGEKEEKRLIGFGRNFYASESA